MQSLKCRVVVRGRVPQDWVDWFTGAAACTSDRGDTVLTCHLSDQSAVHGLTARIRDLGLDLVSLTIETPTSDEATP